MKKLVKKTAPKPETLSESRLKVFDIPLEDLIESAENPNEQDDLTFDQLVDGMRQDGVDEPIIVIPSTSQEGKYLIVSGHHRAKAAKFLELGTIPAVIKAGWSDDKRKIELVRRNMLKGNLNPEKFTALYTELSKKYDKSLLMAQMGFTKQDAFEKLYKGVAAALPAAQKKKLAEAKETVRSVDDLSSVLNNIFKEAGSDLKHGFMVFTFASQKHHYIPVDSELHKMLSVIEARLVEKGEKAQDFFKRVLKKEI